MLKNIKKMIYVPNFRYSSSIFEEKLLSLQRYNNII